ncbi:MAG: carbamoyl-phosphate synthase large subunit, partial [Halobacteriovoraceae bacterium]|nr:carbamoyl-phosphate synthase large subunit [Halobacteriovoraceae bacterium]
SARFYAHTGEEAIKKAGSEVGYPLIIRRDFTLGGKGAALIYNEEDLRELFTAELEFPISLEKSLVGQKEVELEVMVDRQGNGVIVCSIENIDPCGVHTGDSITVAPVQTISDKCYQKLRTMALDIARHMKIVAGGANIQFAINPQDENDITVIEMNPRVSRSSALASKATGYPIAKISTLLAVGYDLQEIPNDITKISPVAFEPTLDYVAVKIPIFPFDKFPTSSQILGPQMRSVGEALSLAGSFNEAFLKALRSTECGLEIPKLSSLKNEPISITREYIENRLRKPHAFCLLTIIEALRLKMSVQEIFDLSKVSPWFIEQMQKIVNAEEEIKEEPDIFTEDKFFNYKSMGFSDKYLALLKKISLKNIYSFRHRKEIRPVYKAVDTCSGEFHAETPYFYSTYNKENEAQPLRKKADSIAILGSGPNRIGQGIEFDYSCVKSCFYLREKKIQAIMINSNPETVSTDYDSSDRLYIAPLYSEDLFDILINEKPRGVISCFSGQTGIKIRKYIEDSFLSQFHHFNFLGASLNTLDLTEDRKLFDNIVKETDLSQTKSLEIKGYKHMASAMAEIGLPVIIRPSYVLGGESMYIFHSHEEIEQLPYEQRQQLKKSQASFLVETYLENALEYDVDLICDNYGNSIFTICEHIEHAGVHSGDSGMICPPIHLSKDLHKKMREISIQLARRLEITGPVNFQYAVKDNQIYCIEANPRGSRTLPFLSKAGNISLPQIATEAMLGGKIKELTETAPPAFCIKQSTFPFDRFLQDNIILGPKMRSTGETMGVDPLLENALVKSYLGNYPNLTGLGKILASISDNSKEILRPYILRLHEKGYEFYATQKTRAYIEKQGVPCKMVAKLGQKEGVNILELLQKEKIKMVLNTPMAQGQSKSDGEYIRNTAIQNGIPCFTRKENIKAILQALLAVEDELLHPVSLQEIHYPKL